MSADGADRGRARTYALMAIDALAYAVVVVAGTLALALVGGLVTGGGLVRAKLLLFLAGWVLLAVATVRLWPRSPTDDRANRAVVQSTPATGAGTRIEAVAAALPPLRWLESPPRRLSPPSKLFVGSLLVLVSSLALEVVFGVR